MRPRLRALRGGNQGGPAGVSCVNHQAREAAFRVGVPLPGVLQEIWMLCHGCAEDMTKHCERVIVAPIRRKTRGR